MMDMSMIVQNFVFGSWMTELQSIIGWNSKRTRIFVKVTLSMQWIFHQSLGGFRKNIFLKFLKFKNTFKNNNIYQAGLKTVS